MILKAIHTPGHTNGSFCFIIDDGNDNLSAGEQNDRHSYLFTGILSLWMA